MTVTELPTSWPANGERPLGHITAFELIARAGISYRQLDYWCRTDLLHALDGTRHGSGTRSWFSLEQLHRAATLRWLLDAGISLQTCRTVIDELLDTGQVQLTDGLVIHLPDDP